MAEIKQNEAKSAQSNIDVIPVNGHVIVAIPRVSKKTEGGIIKSEKAMEEERKSLPKFVEVVAIAENSEFNVGDYVMINAGSNYLKITHEDQDYGILDSFSIVATVVGKMKEEAIKIFNERKILEASQRTAAALKPAKSKFDI